MSNEIIKQEKKEILGSAFMPQTFSDKLKLADVLCKSRLCPVAMNTPEKVFVALQYGHELGLSPMVAVNNIAIVNGKPSLMTDVMAAITFKSGILKEYKVKRVPGTDGTITNVIVTGKRTDNDFEFEGSFSLDQAKKANLLGKDNWKYPEIMLEHRAKSRFFKGICPELLAGFLTPEEAENLEPIDVTEKINLKDVIDVRDDPTGEDTKTEIHDFVKDDVEKNQAEDLIKENFIDEKGAPVKNDFLQKKDPPAKKTKPKKETPKENDNITPDAKNEASVNKIENIDKIMEFDPVKSYTIVFANDRAKKIKHLMTKSELDYFAALAASDSSLYDEMQFNIDIEIIRKYELQFIKNGGK